MTATLRIHRGPASPGRPVLVGTQVVGTLDEETTDLTVAAGTFLVSLALGPYHSVVTRVVAHDDEVVELTVEDNRDAVAPLLQGGFLRFTDRSRPRRA